jgi:hypothetical protein
MLAGCCHTVHARVSSRVCPWRESELQTYGVDKVDSLAHGFDERADRSRGGGEDGAQRWTGAAYMSDLMRKKRLLVYCKLGRRIQRDDQ